LAPATDAGRTEHQVTDAAIQIPATTLRPETVEPDKLYHVTYMMPCPRGHFCVWAVERGYIASGLFVSADHKDFTVQREVQVGEKYHCERCTSTVCHPHDCDDPNTWDAGRL
jgi:hypothetical protein